MIVNCSCFESTSVGVFASQHGWRMSRIMALDVGSKQKSGAQNGTQIR
jgi:hypothetical protein